MLVAAAVLLLGACDDVSQHVYSGFLFDPVNDCVSGTSNTIDLVPGASTGNTCAPVCLTTGSGAVYVSPVCGPYPSGATVEAADAATGAGNPCMAALAAYDEADGGGICGNGGGGDAGDATAGGDASSGVEAGDAAGADAADTGFAPDGGRIDSGSD